MENSYYKLYNRKTILTGTFFSIFMIAMIVYGSSAYGSSGDGNREGGNSMVGNYADGYELGKDNGSGDYRSGNFHDSKCPPNDSLTWCAGYKVGYEVGWAAAAALGN